MRRRGWGRAGLLLSVLWGAAGPMGAAPVSFSREVAPLLDRTCVACHQPAKLKGGLDLTSFRALSAGGKHGVVVVAKSPGTSRLIEQVRGPKPEMPPEGQPLTAAEVALLERWIGEGAMDDTPAEGAGTREPVRYTARPVITALA